MLEFGLTSLLLSDPALSGLIGNRIYAVLVPFNASWPCLSYSVIASTHTYALDRSVFTSKRIQWDSWSLTYSEAKQIAVALGNVIEGYAGTLVDNTVVIGAFQSLSMDLFDNDTKKFRVLTEYMIDYREPAPMSMMFDPNAFDSVAFG